MNPDELTTHIGSVFSKCLEVIKKKNADYSSSNSNAFRNFEAVEMLGITNTKSGMLVRITDKLTRISNLITKPPQVVEESMQDSIEDAINYLALLHARIASEKVAASKTGGAAGASGTQGGAGGAGH